MKIEEKFPILVDKVFIECFKLEIAKLKSERHNRPIAKQGFHYKRDWYDRMSEQSEFHYDFFIKHLPDIIEKKSNIPSEKRNVILYCFQKAYKQTVIYYSTQKQTIKHEDS